MKAKAVVIGGGLSGLAAATRLARYNHDVFLIEQHTRLGGLNSYYYRNRLLLETGLHAITNYAAPDEKHAPLNKIFRQLKLKRKHLPLHEQIHSKIDFSDGPTLLFTNNIEVLTQSIEEHFPASSGNFRRLLAVIDEADPFTPTPFISTRKYLTDLLHDQLLVDMLLCPILYYGSSVENDIDFGQFVIMFRSIFLEGFCRPEGSIKDLIDLLKNQYISFGGNIILGTEVTSIIHKNGHVEALTLSDESTIETDFVLSTIGHSETRVLLDQQTEETACTRLGFIESIFCIPPEHATHLNTDSTITFYNNGSTFSYENPQTSVDFTSGVLCFPQNFIDYQPHNTNTFEIRHTNLANFSFWDKFSDNRDTYSEEKAKAAENSMHVAEKFIGNFSDNIVYQDTFTPVTIKRYTSKYEGAIYGNPVKIKDGDIGYTNLFLAGTDQGFLGIIGSMLSGISIVNQHLLPHM